MIAIFEYRKIELASKLSIAFTLKAKLHEPKDYTDKIKPNNTFTDEYYGFFISKFNAEHMVKAYKSINGTNKIKDWSVADIMVDCLDIQAVNFVTYNEILIDFIKNNCGGNPLTLVGGMNRFFFDDTLRYLVIINGFI